MSLIRLFFSISILTLFFSCKLASKKESSVNYKNNIVGQKQSSLDKWQLLYAFKNHISSYYLDSYISILDFNRLQKAEEFIEFELNFRLYNSGEEFEVQCSLFEFQNQNRLVPINIDNCSLALRKYTETSMDLDNTPNKLDLCSSDQVQNFESIENFTFMGQMPGILCKKGIDLEAYGKDDTTLSAICQDLEMDSALSDKLDCMFGRILSFNVVSLDVGHDCTCGLDITDQLVELKRDVHTEFNSLNNQLKDDVCSKINSSNGWEIHGLAFTEGTINNSFGECGRSDSFCSSTVSVNEKCYFAGHVNYFIYGLSNKLCKDFYQSMGETKKAFLFEKASMATHILGFRVLSKIQHNSQIEAFPRMVWANMAYDWIGVGESDPSPSTFPEIDSMAGDISQSYPVCTFKKDTPFSWHLGQTIGTGLSLTDQKP